MERQDSVEAELGREKYLVVIWHFVTVGGRRNVSQWGERDSLARSHILFARQTPSHGA